MKRDFALQDSVGRAESDGPSDRVRRAAASIDAPELLVSVRSRSEIADALAAGVDIVDLKEPRRGALSPTDVELWRHAAEMWTQLQDQRSRRPNSESRGPQLRPRLSAALGERSESRAVAAKLPGAFDFAKVGPSGCDSASGLADLWTQTRQLLDDRVELVAVAYADFRHARCPPAERVLQQAIQAGFRRCLIDTYRKDGVSAAGHLGTHGLKRLSDLAEQAGLWWALAGSVNLRVVTDLWSRGVRPDCLGVRGDVCERGREGNLSPRRIRCWNESTKSLRCIALR